jgi:hypothetical protein
MVKAAAGKIHANTPILCPSEVAEARERICLACDMCDTENMLCKHPKCGCPVKRILATAGHPGKVEISTQACPMGKWGQWAPDG